MHVCNYDLHKNYDDVYELRGNPDISSFIIMEMHGKIAVCPQLIVLSIFNMVNIRIHPCRCGDNTNGLMHV